MMRKLSHSFLLAATSLISCSAYAVKYSLNSGRLIGEPVQHVVQEGDYFQQIAEQYNVGFYALKTANKDIDPLLPEPGTNLIIPQQLLLPFAPKKGIVINLAELRLFYFEPEGESVYVYPIGIGKQGARTPVLNSYIGEKRKNPDWIPTEEARERHLKEKGVELPKLIPAGKDNPLGEYALRLATSTYLIHGTNQRFGIGLGVSSGCIRMYDEDIEQLFNLVDIGTEVTIVNQPIKFGIDQEQYRWVEVHAPISDNGEVAQFKLSLEGIDFIGDHSEDQGVFNRLLREKTGLPVRMRYQARKVEVDSLPIKYPVRITAK